MRGAVISLHHCPSMAFFHTSFYFQSPLTYRSLAMLMLEFLLIFYYVQFSHALTEYQQHDKCSSSYETVYPRVYHEDFNYRHRRSTFSTESHNNKNLQYKFSSKKDVFHLILTLNEDLISPGFVLERRTTSNVSQSRVQPAYGRHRHCLYHGMVRDHVKSQVAVNVCRGLRGLISLGEEDFFIEPVNASTYDKADDDGAHIIYKVPLFTREEMDSSADNTFYSDFEGPSLDKPIGKTFRPRVRKSISMERTVETMVVVDHTMVEYHKDEDIETYVLTIMNLVAKFYRDSSIGNLVNIALVRLIILEEEQEDLDISTNADTTLDSFCKWQDKLNPEGDELPNHHDNAVLLTRKDLCRHEGKCRTVGLGLVAGMCDRKRSCSISEDNGLSVGFTVAHEMGHNFGMKHDGFDNTCSSYDDSSTNVMSSRVPVGRLPTTWSTCSREYITRFLDSGRGTCLEDSSYPTPYNYPKVLPGVMYSADHQCRLEYGPNSTSCALFESDLCTTLWCSSGGNCLSRGTVAAEGTRCGKDKWCISGECIDIDENPVVIDGGWGPWSEYSKCSLTCGLGVKSKERHCNNPSPSHGGRYCVGERKKFANCKLQDCDPGALSVRAMQCSAYDTIQPNGTQLTWVVADSEGIGKPCQLFCRRRDQALPVRKSDHVINGTPCNRFSRDICIDDICQMVGCDNIISSGAVEDRCGVCHGDGSSCLTIKDTFNTKFERGYVEITRIPAGARNIVVEEIAAAENYIAISNGAGDDILNMDYNIDWSGEYQAAGAMISYERINNKERVEILGPINEPLHIYLVFQAQYPGLTYEYTIPRDVNQTIVIPQSFSWVYTDWSPCSASCGIGYQRSTVICKELIAGLVDDRYCEGKKPDDMQQTCNEHQCPATWWEGPWQHCSGSCGEQGRRQRSVFCIHGSTNGEQVVLDDFDCLHQGKEKPITEITCEVELQCESNDNWQIGEWSQCSVSCGDGWHTRSVVCTNVNKPCDVAGKPSHRRPCFQYQCSTPQDNNDTPNDPESHSYQDDSTADQSYDSSIFSSDFPENFGEWEKKIAIKKYESSVNNSNPSPPSPPEDAPPDIQHELNITTHDINPVEAGVKDSRINNHQVVPDIPYVNFLTFPSALNDKHQTALDTASRLQQQEETTFSWSKELWQPCSVTCGDGIQQRIVKCVDRNTGIRTSGCSRDDQPISLQSCNMGSCPQACRNTLSTTMCLIILQSGSCSQTHFRERCCRTCAEPR